MNWPTIPLGQLADFRNGINYSRKNFGKGIKVIGVSDFQDYSKPHYEDLEEVNPQGVVSEEDILKDEDILFVRSNGNKDLIGRSLFIDSPTEKVTFSGFCIRARFFNKAECPRFYSFIFKSDIVRRTLSARGGGTNIANLNQKILKTLEVPYPPLLVRSSVASILSNYDDLIDNNNRRIALLEESVHRLYREWFVHLRFPGHERVTVRDGVPEGWMEVSLSQITDVISRGVSPKYDESSEKLVINQRCIRDRLIDLQQSRKHTTRVPEKKELQFGDILINSTGVGTLGRVAQVRFEPQDITVDTHVTIVRPKNSIDKDFFGVALENIDYYFATLGAGATGQTELKRQLVGETNVLLPPEELQQQFAITRALCRKQAQILLEKNDKLREARDRLLPRLMNGTLTP